MEKEYNTQLSSNVPISLRRKVEAEARRIGKPVSFLVRIALESYLKQKENTEN